MSFLHDVDSIRQKAGISKPNSALVIGLGVLACARSLYFAVFRSGAFSVHLI